MKPFEVVLTRCSELEQLLSMQLGAQGRGLHEKVTSVEHRLTSRLIGKLRFIASARNQLVHESVDWSDDDLEDFTRACDWARDEIRQRAPAKLAPPVELPLPVKFLTLAVPAPPPPAPIPYSPPVQRAARGVEYADAWPASPVGRFRPRWRTPFVLPLLLVLAAGAAASGELLQIADAFRDFVDRGLQQAFEHDKASTNKLASPDSRSDNELPEIVPGPY